MPTTKESDLLRLSMILENQGETTRNKYICKLTECILFDANDSELSSAEISEMICERFQLQFTSLEIENAITTKGKERIIYKSNKYQLSPVVANQLSNTKSAEDKLKSFVDAFALENQIPKDIDLLVILEKYLYYSFNSNAKNFSTIIGANPQIIAGQFEGYDFQPTAEEIEIINKFISWNNADKNKFFYTIISSCYEYCLITTKKNPSISKRVFKGKRFFLDTNIIFRMAGFNKDDRRFVINTFVDKCKEVGIELCYTSSVYDEIFRVIDRQIDYIKRIVKGQPPVDSDSIAQLSDNYEVNDFYVKYYNWCKEPQNKYLDYISFRKYLTSLVYKELEKLLYVDSSSNKINVNERYNQLKVSLLNYKTQKRPYRKTTNESVETDINQLLFLESLRPKQATNLWEMNDYLVSADQLLVSWANELFDGVPIVVIPSLWLSIILKISGRASDDDYKSFCLFLTLRYHQSKEDDININPIELLSRLSEKTVDSKLKSQIIDELTSNKSAYSFDNVNEYDASIDLAFDKILKENTQVQKEELRKAVEREEAKSIVVVERYEKELSNMKSQEEYAKDFAQKKAAKKTNWYSQREYIPLIAKALPFVIVLVIFIICFVFRNQAAIDFLFDFLENEKISDRLWSVLVWAINLLIISLPTYFGKVWGYLASEKRREKLCNKYIKQQLKVLNNE